jgi:hypothetical protein
VCVHSLQLGAPAHQCAQHLAVPLVCSQVQRGPPQVIDLPHYCTRPQQRLHTQGPHPPSAQKREVGAAQGGLPLTHLTDARLIV